MEPANIEIKTIPGAGFPALLSQLLSALWSAFAIDQRAGITHFFCEEPGDKSFSLSCWIIPIVTTQFSPSSSKAPRGNM